MTVYPAILTGDTNQAQAQIDLAKKLGVSGVQLDVIDGFYADNLTITPKDCTALDFGKLSLDFHLMVDEPMDYLHELISVKSQLPVRAVIAQVEKMSHQQDFLEEAKRHGFLAGLSLDLFTPLEQLESESLDGLNVLQVMGVRAGFQGQEFNPQALEVVKRAVVLRERLKLNFAVLVDGGVKLENATSIKQAGADAVVVGSALWQSQDPQAFIKHLREI